MTENLLPIRQDVFDEVAENAGILTTEAPTFDESGNIIINNASIIGATNGGYTFNSGAQYVNYNIDGVPRNTKGARAIDHYEPSISATFVTANTNTFVKALGFADLVDGKYKFRHSIKSEDYVDLWLIINKSNGGWLIVELKNCIVSTSGSIKTNNRAQSDIPLTFECNYDIADLSEVPFTYYEKEAPVSTSLEV